VIYISYKDITRRRFVQTGVIVEPSTPFVSIAKFVSQCSYHSGNRKHGADESIEFKPLKMEGFLKPLVAFRVGRMNTFMYLLYCFFGLGSIGTSLYRTLHRDKGKMCEDDAQKMFFLLVSAASLFETRCRHECR
jgi:hypothetical protein